MIDWDEVSRAEDLDTLKKVKLWLFQENVRIETEKRELEASRRIFQEERVRLQKELDDLNLRTVQERKRLREENAFFDKKMAILKNGFRQLEEDRQEFEKQKRIEQESRQRSRQTAYDTGDNEDVYSLTMVSRLFAGITNPLVLRKRYKDLVKIYHPDNPFGDEELVQLINREYTRRRQDG